MKKLPSNLDVFLICRFDEQFTRHFQATIFTILDCGFHVRCALEERGSSGPRIEKIMRLIKDCQYCVADISLGDAPNPDQPRLNMAMEVGAFYMNMVHGEPRSVRKSIFVMDVDEHLYEKTISNLKGLDIFSYGHDVNQIISGIRGWLHSLKIPGMKIPAHGRIITRFDEFNNALPSLMAKLEFNPDFPLTISEFNDYVEIAGLWLGQHGGGVEILPE